MTDSGHAGLPYHLILPYLGFNANPGKLVLDKELVNALDGLEGSLPATFCLSNNNIPPKIGDYFTLSSNLAQERSSFRYYTFHSCHEDPSRSLLSTQFNIAEADYNNAFSVLNHQARVARFIANAPAISDSEKFRSITPILKIHLGRVKKGSEKKPVLDNLVKVLDKVAYDSGLECHLSIENPGAGKPGFYNIGESPDDLDFILNNVPNISLTYNTSNVDSINFRELIKKDSALIDEEAIMDSFSKTHNEFLERFSDRIGYMNLSFNNIFFTQDKNGHQYLSKHYPLQYASHHNKFYNYAFVPVIKRAFDILEINQGANACVNVDIPRKTFFGIQTCDCGGSLTEQVESVKLARKIYNRT